MGFRAARSRREPNEAGLIQSPKLYRGDTGVALHLSEGEPDGAHLENMVLSDLLAGCDARLERAEILSWRTTVGDEVDFVVEAGGRFLPIEVESTRNPHLSDTSHLRTFRAEYGKKSRAALMRHRGNELAWIAAGVLAAPWWRKG